MASAAIARTIVPAAVYGPRRRRWALVTASRGGGIGSAAMIAAR
jgi:hypothetical protein